ncbi:MAG: rhodanese-related sulfurtransferase [Caldilineaceae bacterium]|nr:rhodanese-related sulfurtransferase [Caldilineaceae bacterium]
MPNPYGAPEIGALQVNQMHADDVDFRLVDVREPSEYDVSIPADNVIYLPLSRLAQYQLDVIPDELTDKAQQIVVFCHHGIRSAQVVMWLRQQGWTNVLNMAGGIDAWATEVDSSVGFY